VSESLDAQTYCFYSLGAQARDEASEVKDTLRGSWINETARIIQYIKKENPAAPTIALS